MIYVVKGETVRARVLKTKVVHLTVPASFGAKKGDTVFVCVKGDRIIVCKGEFECSERVYKRKVQESKSLRFIYLPKRFEKFAYKDLKYKIDGDCITYTVQQS